MESPSVIKRLLLALAGLTLFSALSEPFVYEIFGFQGLQFWLSLSWYGIQSNAIWQPLSYLFVQYTGSSVITIPFLLTLAFNIYLIWTVGSGLVQSIGSSAFLRLFFLSALFTGLLSLFVMNLTGTQQILSGAWPAVFAMMTAWMLFNPELELLFLYLVPLKAKWIWGGIFGALFLIDLSRQDWVSMVFDLSGALFAYFYALIAWDLKSPWSFTNPIERLVASLKGRFTRIAKGHPKIIDFSTGEPAPDDDAFVDAMLSKISRKGPDSLTRTERQRLDAISAKRRKKQ